MLWVRTHATWCGGYTLPENCSDVSIVLSCLESQYFETSTSYILIINESMLRTLNLKTVFRKLQFRYESLKQRDCYEAPNRTVCKMLHTLGKNQYIFGLTILLGPSAKSLSTSRPFSWFLYNRSDFRPLLLHTVYSRYETGSEEHATSHSVGSGVLFPGVKRPGREVNQSPPTSAKAKNEWSYTSSPPLRLHGVDRKNFLFTFLQQVWTYARTHARTHTHTHSFRSW